MRKNHIPYLPLISSDNSQLSTYTLTSALPYLLIVLSLIGFIAAFIITIEKLHLLQNPSYHPACSVNPVINCGSIMSSKQSHVFGFPNSLIGLAAFPMLATMGTLMLGGARFKRWVWLTLQVGTIGGLFFVSWLFFESVYRIHALCPYCMVVWVTTIALFWYVLLYNLETELIIVPPQIKPYVAYIRRRHADILIICYTIIAALIAHHFWYYFKTVI